MAASVFRKCLLAAGLLVAAFMFWMALMLGSAQSQELPQTSLKGCYLELSASGELLQDGREAAGGIGAGCDMQIAKIIVAGAGVRGTVGEIKSGTLSGRIGVLVNPSLLAYGTSSWVIKDFEAGNNGTLYLGAGLETEVLVNQLSAFVQGEHAVSKFGSDALAVDDARITAGVRIRLQPPKGPATHKPLM